MRLLKIKLFFVLVWPPLWERKQWFCLHHQQISSFSLCLSRMHMLGLGWNLWLCGLLCDSKQTEAVLHPSPSQAWDVGNDLGIPWAWSNFVARCMGWERSAPSPTPPMFCLLCHLTSSRTAIVPSEVVVLEDLRSASTKRLCWYKGVVSAQEASVYW